MPIWKNGAWLGRDIEPRAARPWTAADLGVLRTIYPVEGAKGVAALIGRSVSAVYSKAQAILVGSAKGMTIDDKGTRRS